MKFGIAIVSTLVVALYCLVVGCMTMEGGLGTIVLSILCVYLYNLTFGRIKNDNDIARTKEAPLQQGNCASQEAGEEGGSNQETEGV